MSSNKLKNLLPKIGLYNHLQNVSVKHKLCDVLIAGSSELQIELQKYLCSKNGRYYSSAKPLQIS